MKFVSLISSGIDSPVATYILSKKAKELILLHADIRPFSDDREVDNFIKLAKHLKKITSCLIKVYLIKHGSSLDEFKQNCNNRYTCVFCKRMLLRYAEKIAEKEGADKEDVVKIAKEIDTYNLSILPSSGCDAVPSKPSTKAKLDNILDEESKINIDKLVKEAIEESQILSI